MMALALSCVSVLAFLVCFSVAAPAEEVASSTPTAVELLSVETPRKPYPFGPGERFEFVVKYEFISAGKATMETRAAEPIDGRPALHFVSNARSNDFIDVFFKVRDVNSSLVDKHSLATLSFHQNLREGHYKVIRNNLIFYSKGIYTYERIYKGKTTVRQGEINEPVNDILSSFFRARTFDLKLGESYFIRVFDDKKIYSLRVDVDKNVHEVRVPAGTFECFRLQPFVVGDNIFKGKEDGRMFLWLTTDERRIPVLVRSKVAIGAFDAELENYTLADGTTSIGPHD